MWMVLTFVIIFMSNHGSAIGAHYWGSLICIISLVKREKADSANKFIKAACQMDSFR